MVITALNHVPHCYSSADGLVIAREIRKALSCSGQVTISLKGVSDVPSSFVNAAFVSLLRDYDADWLRKRLTIVDATQQAADMIKRCMRGAMEQLQAA